MSVLRKSAPELVGHAGRRRSRTEKATAHIVVDADYLPPKRVEMTDSVRADEPGRTRDENGTQLRTGGRSDVATSRMDIGSPSFASIASHVRPMPS